MLEMLELQRLLWLGHFKSCDHKVSRGFRRCESDLVRLLSYTGEDSMIIAVCILCKLDLGSYADEAAPARHILSDRSWKELT